MVLRAYLFGQNKLKAEGGASQGASQIVAAELTYLNRRETCRGRRELAPDHCRPFIRPEKLEEVRETTYVRQHC